MQKLLTVTLTLLLIFTLAGCESNYEAERNLLENGPWADEATWTDDASQMYLVCTTDSSPFADVTACLSINGQWYSTQLSLYQGAPIVCFSTPDDERVLEARAKMNGQTLLLYDFKVHDEHFTVPYDSIELSKSAAT